VSNFFDSEVVRKEIKEIDEMQNSLFSEMIYLPYFSKEEKKEHLKLLKRFLEKQKLFIFRLSLSDDESAVKMKESILDSAQLLGFKKEEGFDAFFKHLEGIISNLENSIDD